MSPHGLPDSGISNTGKSPPESGGEGAGVTTGEGSGGALVVASPESLSLSSSSSSSSSLLQTSEQKNISRLSSHSNGLDCLVPSPLQSQYPASSLKITSSHSRSKLVSSHLNMLRHAKYMNLKVVVKISLLYLYLLLQQAWRIVVQQLRFTLCAVEATWLKGCSCSSLWWSRCCCGRHTYGCCSRYICGCCSLVHLLLLL